MEVIEDGNIMDRIPILLQRDLEYYQNNQTVLSEKICSGVVGGRLDFPRSASFAAVKIVLWLEEEFSVAFKQGSGMFVTLEDDNIEGGVAKTSDPDKFVQLAIKSSDSLLEHLHMLAQEALDHADLPVLTATLGAAALLKNSLYCYLQHIEDTGLAEMQSIMQSCYKRYVTMSEAVGERVLDLHNRVLSLYILQDSGGRPIDLQRTIQAGTPSVNGWWLYMNGSRKDLWDTVPPRMAQRIFAGMLNETLTILTVRYCQTSTDHIPLLVNDIVNILLCTAQLLPCICACGSDLVGLQKSTQSRDVRDVHAKCNELFKCMVFRGAELHFLHQVLMMRNCHLARMLLISAIRNMSSDNSRWPADGLWYGDGTRHRCDGFLCTADGFCTFTEDKKDGEEYARAVGALSHIIANIGSTDEVKSTLCYALEVSGRDWAACLDKRQVWCDRRPSWLAGVMGLVGTALEFIPSVLVNAIQSGASMYQTMSLCLTCISRTLISIPRSFLNTAEILEKSLPTNIHPVGGSVVLQMLITVVYEELLKWAKKEALKETAACGDAKNTNVRHQARAKQVRIHSMHTTMSSSVSFDGSHSSPSSIALAVAEALCSIDEDDKHTNEIENLFEETKKKHSVSNAFGLEDFPEFAEFFEEGNVAASNAERSDDAAALTSQILMTSAGRDSLRVLYDHLQTHSERIYKDFGIQDDCDVTFPLNRAPLLYIMFHIGRRPFDQYFRGEWPMPWSRLVSAAKAWSGTEGAKIHVNRRTDIRNIKNQKNKQLLELYSIFKGKPEGLL
ncbi:uncharacterized protein LOC125053179 isoform X2 [Pieris napi]|uniref:uncharacterized protein LOC125053179 isoform X2 n=1 Tax=Pieris napi TaxID=78633 RepID=UPI001FBAF9C0|nr:uncharacterized protein LOC125053179 isoform X2 [Pieris napi]